jgi:predicted flap endonuclease-1-like 5' DNA nuclease
MSIPVNELRGATDALVAKLKEQGVGNSDQLLDAAASPGQRKALAEHAGVESRVILELANRADLSRVKGVAGAYSDLLEKAGVDTVKELAARRPDNLHAKILETNEQEKLTPQPPSASMVEGWVAQAKDLPKILTY